jgi:hypothetical protein
MKRRGILTLASLSGLLFLAHARTADACGGCFHPPTPSTNPMTTVVTAHRMAFAFSTARTVLWDQIQYSGDPREFSWVLPIHGDATLEAGDDAWFESLEAVTNTQVTPPQLNCFVSSTQDRSMSCACGGMSSDSASFAGTAGSDRSTVPPGVMVVHEGTVGPYAFVQLSATNSMSLEAWLAANGYVIPPDVQPVVDAYVHDGFGFIALKLRPNAGTRQMTPVRVITAGASPTLPLRMVAAGTGAQVGITLYVVAEGRYEPDAFESVTIDWTKLSWDWRAQQSNYAQLRATALASSGDGSGWLTTFAIPGAFRRTFSDPLGQTLTFAPMSATAVSGAVGPGTFTTLAGLYFAQASANAQRANLCPSIDDRLSSELMVVDTCRPAPAPPPASDAGTADAGAADGALAPIPVVCDAAPANKLAAHDFQCGDFSDIAAAMIGMHPNGVWITRLEANLPHAALAADLNLRAARDRSEVGQTHRAITHVNPPCDLLENHQSLAPQSHSSSGKREASLGFVSALGLLAMRRMARRAREKSAGPRG